MSGLAVISYAEMVAAALDGRPAAAVLGALDGSLGDPGAFRLVDAPVPDDLLGRMHATTGAFFALPLETKARYRYPADPYTGWCGGAYLGTYGSADRKEMYHIGPRHAPTLVAHGTDGRLPAPAPVTVDEAVAGCPLWPAEPGDFVPVWHEYYRWMQVLSAGLGRALALLLGIGTDEWFAATAGNWADLAANWYPPLGSTAAEGAVYNAAHRDLTMFTILHQDGSRLGGLAVETASGAWVPVEADPAGFVVNAGELLTFCSGGRWRAAPHRVMPAPGGSHSAGQDSAGRPRLSVPFFYRPSDERVIGSFVDGSAAPVAVGAWVTERKQASVRAQ